ncbi:unnamed protein product [Camellia sinensis]
MNINQQDQRSQTLLADHSPIRRSHITNSNSADYNPDQYLWEEDFTLAAESTKDRTLRQLRNQRGHTLQCSHYVGSPFPEDTPLPCVVYCHGNRMMSGGSGGE